MQNLLKYLAFCQNSPKYATLCFQKMHELLLRDNLIKDEQSKCDELKDYVQKTYKITNYEYEVVFKKAKEVFNVGLDKEKEQIFKTLMSSNFSKYKDALDKSIQEFELSLDKVDAKVYMLVKTYIEMINLCLEMSISFTKEQNINEFSEFGLMIHHILLKEFLYDEEREQMQEGLEKALAVYISLYFKKCLMN